MAANTSLFVTLMVLCVLNVILMPGTTHARPPSLLSRQKRISDQRLAEIETLLGLENVRGKVVTVPIAFGLLDPDKIALCIYGKFKGAEMCNRRMTRENTRAKYSRIDETNLEYQFDDRALIMWCCVVAFNYRGLHHSHDLSRVPAIRIIRNSYDDE